MKRLDSTYWTDGKDIFYRMGNEWVKVTGEDSTQVDNEDTEDSTVVDSGTIVVFRRVNGE